MKIIIYTNFKASAVSALGNFYVSGGYSAQAIVDTMEAYDPYYTRTWTNVPSMPLALSGHCMQQYKDSLVVIGGTNGTEMESDKILSFNITTNKWTELGSISQARTGHGCSLVERSVFKLITFVMTLNISGRMVLTSLSQVARGTGSR